MAYKNLINITCVDKAEFFCRFRDFICARNGTYDYSTTGIGWTLYDAVYTVDENNPELGDYFVAYSAGESGNEDLYFSLEWASGEITVYGYLSWDAVAHTGTFQYGYGGELTIAETGEDYRLFVYGDMDQVSIIQRTSTYGYVVGFGKLENAIEGGSEDTALCSSAVSSGTDVVVTVDAIPSTWFVGMSIVIRDDSGVEVTEIKAISGTDVTLDLTNSYSSPKLSEFNGYFLSYGNRGFGDSMSVLIGWGGSTDTNANNYATTICQQIDPGPLGYYALNKLHMAREYCGYVGSVRNVYACSGLSFDDVVVDIHSGTEYRYVADGYIVIDRYAFKEV